MANWKPVCHARGNQVPQDPAATRSHRTVVSLHTPPFASLRSSVSTHRPDQRLRRHERARVLPRPEWRCRNRCGAFPECPVSCHIDESGRSQTRRCLYPIDPRFRKQSSKPVSGSGQRLRRPRHSRWACMSLRKSPEIFRRAWEARVLSRRRFPEALPHQTNNEFASLACFRRQVSPRSSRPSARHKARFCESGGNAEAAVDGRGRVRPRHSTALWGLYSLPAEVASQGRPREWPRANLPTRCLLPAPSLKKNLCAFGFKSETHFSQSPLAHGMTESGFIFSIEHEK